MEPIVSEGATSTITYTFDDPIGYVVVPPSDGTFEMVGGKLRMREKTPLGSVTGTNGSATGWSVNANDDDGLPILQTVAGETVDSVAGYDATATDNAAMKIRGNCAGGTKNANEVLRGSATAGALQIHAFWMYANSQGTATTRNGFLGVWTNTTTPQCGILWDPNDGVLPNTFILASGGVSAWPSFNTEESTGISRTTDQWIFVLWAGRVITIGATDYYTRVVVMNSTVVKKQINVTSPLTVPTGGRFGAKITGDYSSIPAYFDSYKVWETQRYPMAIQVLSPPCQPKSLREVTAYTLSEASGVDIGGTTSVYYRVSLDGGVNYGSFTSIDQITSEAFGGKGDDVIQMLFVLVSSGTNPDTGLAGLFSPSVNSLQLEFVPLWVEEDATVATWTEAA